MNRKEVLKELKDFINSSIKSRVENNLHINKIALIEKTERYLNMINKEYNAVHIVDIENIVNKELFAIVR